MSKQRIQTMQHLLFFFLSTAIVSAFGAPMNCTCQPGWSEWHRLQGVTIGKPAITSFDVDSLNVFVRGTDNQLWARYFDAGKWLNWVPHGGKLTSAPAVTSPETRKLYLVVRGSDNQYWVRLYNSKDWLAWEPIGGNSTMDPAIISPTASQAHVFLCNSDGMVYMRTKNEGAWNPWTSLNKMCSSPPTAVMLNGNEYSVAFVNDEGTLSVGRSTNAVWSWINLNIPSVQSPAMTTWDFNELVIFTKNRDGAIMMTFFDKNSQDIASMTKVTGEFSSAPGAGFIAYKKIVLSGATSNGETVISTMSG